MPLDTDSAYTSTISQAARILSFATDTKSYLCMVASGTDTIVDTAEYNLRREPHFGERNWRAIRSVMQGTVATCGNKDGPSWLSGNVKLDGWNG